MRKPVYYALVVVVSIFTSCNTTDETKSKENSTEVKTETFTEGSVEMGMFSQGVDLGKLLGKIDFSRDDVQQQYDSLHQHNKDVKAIFELIEQAGKQNPMLAWAIMMNILESTYFIKENMVLANARGFGWNTQHYYNIAEDKGSMYFETHTRIPEIPEADRSIYVTYQPSVEQGSTSSNTLDLGNFNREVQSKQENIAGYNCNVVTYTAKTIDETLPLQLYKIKVYTSSLFSNAINFAHPFYLEEPGGILRLDVFYTASDTPTLVMEPKQVKSHTVSAESLSSKTATPVYAYNDMNWAFKSLAIMMSGWGELEN